MRINEGLRVDPSQRKHFVFTRHAIDRAKERFNIDGDDAALSFLKEHGLRSRLDRKYSSGGLLTYRCPNGCVLRVCERNGYCVTVTNGVPKQRWDRSRRRMIREEKAWEMGFLTEDVELLEDNALEDNVPDGDSINSEWEAFSNFLIELATTDQTTLGLTIRAGPTCGNCP
jgi:hypothetical protein